MVNVFMAQGFWLASQANLFQPESEINTKFGGYLSGIAIADRRDRRRGASRRRNLKGGERYGFFEIYYVAFIILYKFVKLLI